MDHLDRRANEAYAAYLAEHRESDSRSVTARGARTSLRRYLGQIGATRAEVEGLVALVDAKAVDGTDCERCIVGYVGLMRGANGPRSRHGRYITGRMAAGHRQSNQIRGRGTVGGFRVILDYTMMPFEHFLLPARESAPIRGWFARELREYAASVGGGGDMDASETLRAMSDADLTALVERAMLTLLAPDGARVAPGAYAEAGRLFDVGRAEMARRGFMSRPDGRRAGEGRR